jgi:Rad51
MMMLTASEYYKKIKQVPPLSSGDPTMDTLLKGGFISGPNIFLYGPRRLLSLVLMKTAVNSFQANVDGGYSAHRVLYVDGENLFNPYFISKMAVSKNLDPQFVLKRIKVARTFTWNQMVEVVEEKIANISDAEDSVDLVLVGGMTSQFNDTNGASKTPGKIDSRSFQDLNRMFSGLKVITERYNPVVVLTGPLHPKSLYRPMGGKLISHFCGIVVGIHKYPRYFDYSLDAHPFLPYRKERYWIPLENRSSRMKPGRMRDPHNLSLDYFMKKPSLPSKPN